MQPAVVLRTGQPAIRGDALNPQCCGGQDVTRSAIFEGMDTGKNGSRNNLRSGKPDLSGAGHKPFCRRHVLSALRKHGAHHPRSTHWRGNHDLQRKLLFRRVQPSGGSDPLPSSAIDTSQPLRPLGRTQMFRSIVHNRQSCNSLLASMNLPSAKCKSWRVWLAEICVRMRALPCGTTG